MTEEKTKELYELLVVQGVYGKVKNVTIDEFVQFVGSNGFNSLDLYCPKCKENKTFVYNACEGSSLLGTTLNKNYYERHLRCIIYKCPTCGQLLYFLFFYNNGTVIKLAQYPSLYDVSRDELKKYQKNELIDKDSFAQIYKADICASQGYYVAAYTYMRRVYEALLLSIFNENSTEIGMSEEDYRKLRSDEKMQTIRPYLAIDEEIYKPLYALLSVGIHTLSEEDCCNDYALLKSILLDVLEEQKTRKAKQEKRKEIATLYAQRKGELK